jgi:hypothetical protein
MKLLDWRPLGVCVLVLAFVVLVNPWSSRQVEAQTLAPGGFVESDTATTGRTPLTAEQVAAFMPTRGAFTFPAPYGTQAFRITTSSDCGGSDCVRPVGYAYWRNINNHAGSDTMLIFLSLDRTKGGTGPTLFSVNKITGETKNLGALFDANSSYGNFHGEGWYFSATQPTKLYVHNTRQLQRYDVLARTFETVFDISARFGTDTYVWQLHSSNDDRVHSFTLRQSGTWATLGCAVYSENTRDYWYFPARGDYDECQIDKSGRYLVIKDNVDGQAGEDNIIKDLQTGSERIYYDQQGAGGHSDNGFGYAVAEDNWAAEPGAVRIFRFDQDQSDTSNGNGTLVFRTTTWGVSAGHIAHANAVPGTPISQQYACSSTATQNTVPRANEVLCWPLDGSLQSLVVAPIMTDLSASGGGSDSYFKQPKGNLDPTGEYFIWTTNMGGNRLDAVIVRIPKHKLPSGGGTTAPSPDPSPTPSPTPSAAAVQWTSLVNASVSGTVLTKSSGCDGCAGGAASVQQIASGDGYLEFTATETTLLRAVGLSNGNPGTTIGEIKFAIRLQGGWAEVRESGLYKADTAFKTGDVLRVAVSGGKVTYSKNGAVFYTSSAAPSYPLLVDAWLAEMNATIGNAVIGTGGTSAPQGGGPATVIDRPVAGAVTSPFTVSGWAVDRDAASGTGVDAVHVWAFPSGGGSAQFVGAASYGVARTDVGAHLGSRFDNSGYELSGSGLAAGAYRLVVFARSTVTGAFSDSRTVDITVSPSTLVFIDAPRANDRAYGTVLVAGWAADMGPGSDSGVDAIHVYARSHQNGSYTFLGVAANGGSRPDVAAVLGSRYSLSGYSLTASSPPGGWYDVVVFARCKTTQEWASSAVQVLFDP